MTVKKENVRVQVTIPKLLYDEMKEANINISKHLRKILENYKAVEVNLVIKELERKWKKQNDEKRTNK